MRVIEFLKRILGFKEKIPSYPREFALVDFSSTALGEGIEDDQNKMIIKYSYDKFGNLKIDKKRYSKERVYALKMIRRIPIKDKTKKEVRFEVYTRSNPGVVSYKV